MRGEQAMAADAGGLSARTDGTNWWISCAAMTDVMADGPGGESRPGGLVFGGGRRETSALEEGGRGREGWKRGEERRRGRGGEEEEGGGGGGGGGGEETRVEL
ncbi:predicted protein [Histoplasma mississippiense (nom. inval.)]|uniref:predicted protein n=1 Tax=Ajellomyces capsulatus (strain NAm1 / WU24) TaxID=2059318 RepID=UPI000157BADF|nr:predicted protein [Histoplasma mississippiense (nom. inval.)]EDN05798.1 predicted protein [Histoplasma mississippiense (nom. inval.)]